MPGRVKYADPAEHRQLVAFLDRLRMRRRPCQERDDRTGREISDHFAEPDTQALGVRRVQEDLGAGEGRDLVDTTDVIGVAVRAHDARDVLERAADAGEVRTQEPCGAGVSGVDERDLVAFHEQIGLSADEPHHMDVW